MFVFALGEAISSLLLYFYPPFRTYQILASIVALKRQNAFSKFKFQLLKNAAEKNSKRGCLGQRNLHRESRLVGMCREEKRWKAFSEVVKTPSLKGSAERKTSVRCHYTCFKSAGWSFRFHSAMTLLLPDLRGRFANDRKVVMEYFFRPAAFMLSPGVKLIISEFRRKKRISVAARWHLSSHPLPLSSFICSINVTCRWRGLGD